MRENCATDLHDLIIDCPTCAGTGWVEAVTGDQVRKMPHLTIACPTCCGHSWVPAVGSERAEIPHVSAAVGVVTQ